MIHGVPMGSGHALKRGARRPPKSLQTQHNVSDIGCPTFVRHLRFVSLCRTFVGSVYPTYQLRIYAVSEGVNGGLYLERDLSDCRMGGGVVRYEADQKVREPSDMSDSPTLRYVMGLLTAGDASTRWAIASARASYLLQRP